MSKTSRPHSSESIEQPYSWLVAGASLLLMSTAFGSTYLVIVGLKPIAAEFGWPRSVPSLAFALASFGAGLGGIILGFLEGRSGTFGPVVIGTFAVAAGAIASGFVQNATMLYLAQGLLLGLLGSGATFVPLMTNVTRWFDRNRGLAIAIVSAGQSLGGAVWPPIYRWGVEEYGWRETMIAYGFVAFVIMAPLTLVFRRRPPVPPANAADGGGRSQPDSAALDLPPGLLLALLSIAIVGCCVAMAMPMSHVVAYCTDLGYAAARGAEMLSLLLAVSLFSRLFAGWLTDRIGGLLTIVLGSALQLVALTAYIFIDSLWGLYLVSAAFGVGFGSIIPAYAMSIRELFPINEVGWRNGVVFFFGMLGMALGGYLGGAVFDWTGNYQMAFVLGVAFNVLNLMALLPLAARQGARLAPSAALA